MIKKYVACLLAVCIAFSLGACKNGYDVSEPMQSQEQSDAEQSACENTPIDMTSAYVCDKEQTVYVQIVFNCPPSLPEGNGAVYFGNESSARELPEEWYAIYLRRSLNKLTVEEADVKKTSSKYFTLVFRSEEDIEKAKKAFKAGSEVIIENLGEIHAYGVDKTMIINKKPYKIDGVNNTENTQNGIFAFDNNNAYTAVPKLTANQRTVLVSKNTVIYVSSAGEDVVFPKSNGAAFVFTGDKAKELDVSFGDPVEFLKYEPCVSPCSYVMINGIKQEINYINTSRTAYSDAVLYDGNFKSSTTQTNIWGLEIAVDGNNKVTEVRKSNTEGFSGNTPIPKDGYVLSVGSGSRLHNSLSKTKVGDDAVLCIETTPYFVYKMALGGRNKERKGENAVVYDEKSGSFTPRSDGVKAEFAVNKHGYVISFGNENGKTEIPKDGCVVSVYGASYDEMSRFCKIGSRLAINDSASVLYIVNYPDVVYGDAKVIYENCKKQYEKCKEELYNIDFASANVALEQIKALLDKAENAVSATEYVENLSAAYEKAIQNEYAFSPTVAVQDRGVWTVTPPFSENEVKKMCEDTVKYGCNTVIVSVWDGVFATYRSKIDGVVTAENHNDFDALEAFCRIGHEMGLNVVAMPCCFAAGTTLTDLPENHYVRKFAEANKLLLSKKGTYENRFYDHVTYTLDLFDEEVQSFMLSVYREILESYDFDGIQLDYIRFPLPNSYGIDPDDFGYNENTVKAFMKWASTDINPKTMNTNHELWGKWCEFRRNIVTEFAKRVKDLVDEVSADTEFTVTCFAGYDDRQKYVFQDTEKLLDSNTVDGVFTMIYGDNYEYERKYAEELVSHTENPFNVMIGIGTYVGAEKYDIARQLYLPCELQTKGASVFGLAYIQSCGYARVFTDSVYRKPAVRTDKYTQTVSAGTEELLECIAKVYEFFYEHESFEALKAGINAILEYSKAVRLNTSDERYAYVEKTVAELENTKTLVSYEDPKLTSRIKGQIDYLITCLLNAK